MTTNKVSKRIVTHEAAYDCKRNRPCAMGNDDCTGDLDKNHGIRSARYIYTVSGENRAVEMVVMTGHYRAETLITFSKESRRLLVEDPMAELIFHYPFNRFDSKYPPREDCDHTGGDCWVNSGSLWGQAVWDEAMRQHDGAEENLFLALEKIWDEMDEEGDTDD